MAEVNFATLLERLRARAQSGDAALPRDVAALCRQFPAQADAWVLLARVQLRRGDHPAALAALTQANALGPPSIATALEIGVMQFSVGDKVAAAHTLERAIAAHPRDAGLLFHRAYLHEVMGESASAEALYRRALDSDPAHGDSLANLGVMLSREGRHVEARSLLEAALHQRPQAIVVEALIASCTAQDAIDAAMKYAEHAIKTEPNSAAAWMTAGITARKLRDLPRAEHYLRRAAQLGGAGAAGRALRIDSELAAVSVDAGDYARSRLQFSQAIQRRPANLALHWMAAMALPSPAMSQAESSVAISNFDTDLDALTDLVDRADAASLREGYDAATRFLPFPLAYLATDHGNRLRRYGTLLQKLTSAVAPSLANPVDWRALEHSGKPRIGFVSANLRTHTITRYFRSWLSGMDRSRFTIHAWHVGQQHDAESDAIAADVDYFHVGPVDPLLAAESIRAARLDVLIFLDVGMEARVSALASLRSAPLQCAAYGHPLTTGLESIDIFLSGAALERDGAQRHYVERLVTLPGLGVQPLRPPVANTAFAAPRRDGRAQVLCTQMPFKLQPGFDRLAADLLAASDAELFMISGQGTAATLQHRVLHRLADALRERGLDPARHLRLLPNCAYVDYLGIVANADLVLDTPGFTGGATSLDAFHVGTPIATIDGTTLRARQSAAMAGLIGVTDLVAGDIEDCAERAVAILGDADHLRDLSERTRAAAPILFYDCRPIVALNDLLQALAEQARDCRAG